MLQPQEQQITELRALETVAKLKAVQLEVIGPPSFMQFGLGKLWLW